MLGKMIMNLKLSDGGFGVILEQLEEER